MNARTSWAAVKLSTRTASTMLIMMNPACVHAPNIFQRGALVPAEYFKTYAHIQTNDYSHIYPNLLNACIYLNAKLNHKCAHEFIFTRASGTCMLNTAQLSLSYARQTIENAAATHQKPPRYEVKGNTSLYVCGINKWKGLR